MLDVIAFAVFPYVAVFLAVAVGLFRFFTDRYSYTSLSSQFLERRTLFWSSAPWHYAILIVLLAHVLAAVLAGLWAALVGVPERLFTLEAIGLALGLSAVVSAALFILRRLSSARLASVTTTLDWLLMADLLLQVALGVYVALAYRWGSVWYLSTVVPWFASLVQLDPRVEYIAQLPLIAKLHFFNAFVLIALFPFTRLAHIVTLPIAYLWRPHQVVIWLRK